MELVVHNVILGGYDPNKPAYLYIHKINYNNDSYYKFGITNNYKNRFRDYNKNTLKTEKYKSYYSEDGRYIQSIESYIKNDKDIKIGVLDKSLYQDGFSETIHETSLNKILEIINNFNLKEMKI